MSLESNEAADSLARKGTLIKQNPKKVLSLEGQIKSLNKF